MNISLTRKQKSEGGNPFHNSTPYDKRYGFWGVVREVHPEDCTVHVLTDMGIVLTGVRVASAEWVTVEKDKPLTGERHLPPVDTYVFCMMPTGEYTRKIYNKMEDPTISIEVDQETDGDEKATITVHGMVITATKDDGLHITTDKKITLKDKEGFNYDTEGDASISAKGAVTVKSKASGTLEFGNSVATLGALIDDLLGYLAQLKTVGSPASHTAAPDFIANIQVLKTKWGQVFK